MGESKNERGTLLSPVPRAEDQSFELSFWLLGLLHDAKAMRRAHAHLAGNDARRKAWAIELVDAVLTPQEKLLVQEQIDTHHRTQKVGDKSWVEAQLEGHPGPVVASAAWVDDRAYRPGSRAGGTCGRRSWMVGSPVGNSMRRQSRIKRDVAVDHGCRIRISRFGRKISGVSWLDPFFTTW